MASKKYPGIGLAAVKRIFRATMENFRADMRGLIIQRGEYYLCDGFRILHFNKNIDLQQVTTDECNCNFQRYIDEAKQHTGEFLTLPSIDELKQIIIDEKERNKKYKTIVRLPICLDGFIYVNPKYLLDMMQAFPGCTAYKPKDNIGAIYFVSDAGDGILLPVRPPEETEEERIARLEEQRERDMMRIAAERKQCKETNSKTSDAIDCAIKCILEGKKFDNSVFRKYPDADDIYNYAEKCVILWLADRYKIDVASRTKGWIAGNIQNIGFYSDENGDSFYRVYLNISSKAKRIPSGVSEFMSELIRCIKENAAEAEESETDEIATDDDINNFFGLDTDENISEAENNPAVTESDTDGVQSSNEDLPCGNIPVANTSVYWAGNNILYPLSNSHDQEFTVSDCKILAGGHNIIDTS